MGCGGSTKKDAAKIKAAEQELAQKQEKERQEKAQREEEERKRREKEEEQRKKDEEEAATKIQAMYKGGAVRESLKEVINEGSTTTEGRMVQRLRSAKTTEQKKQELWNIFEMLELLDPNARAERVRDNFVEANLVETCVECIEQLDVQDIENVRTVSWAINVLVQLTMNDSTVPILLKCESIEASCSALRKIRQELQYNAETWAVVSAAFRLLFAVVADDTECITRWTESGALAYALDVAETELRGGGVPDEGVIWSLAALRSIARDKAFGRDPEFGERGLRIGLGFVHKSARDAIRGQKKDELLAEHALALLANLQQGESRNTERLHAIDQQVWRAIVDLVGKLEEDPDVVYQGLFALGIGAANAEELRIAILTAGARDLAENICQKEVAEYNEKVMLFAKSLFTILNKAAMQLETALQ
uniref:IBB domain-containing protein n=1 Tax=Chromera velia CCMP2878 TaxID=1169474 RepID=A0A0G4GPD6_9ALVE|eukprot:Cvel_5003.t1-p1 / transcript=Cvel_5003.t1 / gene=Cvel_5003 / organism=Chromera_velia_CCMP2878 / gene_product=hypothetical protein / transcript_product=hypothetical protein / location=Cvel_scaffold226:105862-108719(-) / protein_length=420 / sequence_SO=supercontig / SO=protein_coding / is_pseudo=false